MSIEAVENVTPIRTRTPSELARAGEELPKQAEITISDIASEWLPDVLIMLERAGLYRRGVGKKVASIVRVRGREIEAVWTLGSKSLDLLLQSVGVALVKGEGKPATLDKRRPWLEEAALGLAPVTCSGLEPLTDIGTDPIVTRYGSIVSEPGYYGTGPDTGVMIIEHEQGSGRAMIDVPEVGSVTRAQASKAFRKLAEIFADFPFVDSDLEIVKCLSLPITLAVRPVVDTCPLFVITANRRGTGKGKLGEGLAWLAGVEPWSAFVPKHDEEFGKRLDSELMKRGRLVVADEVSADKGIAFSSSTLNAYSTTEALSIRVMGGNETLTVGSTVILGIGNHVVVEDDTRRRVVPIVLATEHVDPVNRDDFTFAPAGQWLATLKSREAEFKGALWTLIRWCLDARGQQGPARVPGFPSGPGPSSFGLWHGTVMAPLAELAGVSLGREAWHRADETTDHGLTCTRWLAGWIRRKDPCGMTATQIAESLRECSDLERGECPIKNWAEKPPTSGRVGRDLRPYLGRVIEDPNGARVWVTRKDPRGGCAYFAVETRQDGPCAGLA